MLSVVAPDITSFLVPRLVQLGMNATLTCAVSGIPQPRIKWYRNSALLSVTSSVFVIDHVSEADGGVYTCIAFNAAGRKSNHGNLIVQGLFKTSSFGIQALYSYNLVGYVERKTQHFVHYFIHKCYECVRD